MGSGTFRSCQPVPMAPNVHGKVIFPLAPANYGTTFHVNKPSQITRATSAKLYFSVPIWLLSMMPKGTRVLILRGGSGLFTEEALAWSATRYKQWFQFNALDISSQSSQFHTIPTTQPFGAFASPMFKNRTEIGPFG